MSSTHDSWDSPFGPVPEELPASRATLSTILDHTSVREFTGEPLGDMQLSLLCEAIRRAPTSSAMQTTLYVTVTDPELLRQLRPHAGNARFLDSCSAYFVGCMDLRHLDRLPAERGYPNRSSDFRLLLTSVEDISISLQNASLAAQSQGLGTVMVGGTIDGAPEINDLLGLPERVIPILGLAIGWPAAAKPPLKPRLPRPLIFHHNRWGITTEQEEALLQAHDRELTERGYYRDRMISWQELATPGSERVTAETYGWQEHAARKQARSWWRTMTPKLIADLQKLGWNPEDLFRHWNNEKTEKGSTVK